MPIFPGKASPNTKNTHDDDDDVRRTASTLTKRRPIVTMSPPRASMTAKKSQPVPGSAVLTAKKSPPVPRSVMTKKPSPSRVRTILRPRRTPVSMTPMSSSQVKSVFMQKARKFLGGIRRPVPSAINVKKTVVTLEYKEYFKNINPFTFGPRGAKKQKKKLTFYDDETSAFFHKYMLKRYIAPDVIDTKWFASVQSYISTLGNRERYAVFAYTKNPGPYQSLKNNKRSVRGTVPVDMLFYEFIHYMADSKNPRTGIIMNDKVSDSWMASTEQSVVYALLMMKPIEYQKLLSRVFPEDVFMIYRQFTTYVSSSTFTKSFIATLFSRYNDVLDRVIRKAPPLTKPMVVYRRIVKDKKPVPGDVFKMEDFLVTAIESRDEYRKVKGQCCFDVMTILPGTRCLPLLGLSDAPPSVLLNRGTKLIVRDVISGPAPVYNAYKPPRSVKMTNKHIVDILVGT